MCLLPEYVVVQLMIPANAPSISMFGGHTDENGPGYAVIVTFRISEVSYRFSMSDHWIQGIINAYVLCAAHKAVPGRFCECF